MSNDNVIRILFAPMISRSYLFKALDIVLGTITSA
jgi:hypothetical protein